jgi:defect-in-organelle-trafficking protein DotC
MPEHAVIRRSQTVITAAVCAMIALCGPASAQDAQVDPNILLQPSQAAVDAGTVANANPLNAPITGALTAPSLTGGPPPPSLDALQAARPDKSDSSGGNAAMRLGALQQAALSYGARGGLAAESYAINIMLEQYQGILYRTFNFSNMVDAISNGGTLMVPPIVSEAQMAFALSPGGQTAKETDKVYEITQEARLASAPPNWRTYLVRNWSVPAKPPNDLMPRSVAEANEWTGWVAQGWALGQQQGVQIFLDDLSRLQSDYMGMLRYEVLLRSGYVRAPVTSYAQDPVSGGRDLMLIDNQVIRIVNQPGLNPNARDWQGGFVPSGGPIGTPGP